MTTEPRHDERRHLIETCRYLSSAGLSPGSSGNVSVRHGDVILMTPTGSSLRRVAEDDLAVVALDGSAENSGPRPSKELAVHLAAYGGRVDVGAVIHLHSPWATAIACLPTDDGLAPLPPLTPYRVMRLGPVPVAPYARPGSERLGEQVGELASAHDVILLANHGSVILAADLDRAVDLAEELETAAMVTLLTAGRGTPLTHDETTALAR